MEFLKSRRVDFVSFNAVSALSQLLVRLLVHTLPGNLAQTNSLMWCLLRPKIGALLLPMFAIMEMQIENLLDASNSSASVGLAPFNATLFHDFLLRCVSCLLLACVQCVQHRLPHSLCDIAG